MCLQNKTNVVRVESVRPHWIYFEKRLQTNQAENIDRTFVVYWCCSHFVGQSVDTQSSLFNISSSPPPPHSSSLSPNHSSPQPAIPQKKNKCMRRNTTPLEEKNLSTTRSIALFALKTASSISWTARTACYSIHNVTVSTGLLLRSCGRSTKSKRRTRQKTVWCWRGITRIAFLRPPAGLNNSLCVCSEIRFCLF